MMQGKEAMHSEATGIHHPSLEEVEEHESIFLRQALSLLRRGVELGGLPEELYTFLSHPERVLVVYVPVRRDDGTLEVLEGYRVQHNTLLGPYKGGIRFHPEVTLADDMALATLMTLKNSLAGLPYGGGKGARRVNPKALSRKELEAVSRGYARAIAALIGEPVDIPAPDVGTNPQWATWWTSTLAFAGTTPPACSPASRSTSGETLCASTPPASEWLYVRERLCRE